MIFFQKLLWEENLTRSVLSLPKRNPHKREKIESSPKDEIIFEPDPSTIYTGNIYADILLLNKLQTTSDL